jgi:glutamine synthetase
MTCAPGSIEDLRVWNYDGSSTEQAEGHNSEVLLYPRRIFKDPFKGAPHILVICDVFNAWDGKPSIGNTRAPCAEIMEKYAAHLPWFGIEQEYTLMKPGKVGERALIPFGFNDDGSEPAPQGPYYCSAGANIAIGRVVADEHYAKCMAAGVKISGVNAEVMPGQWEYQIGPCRGIEMGDHLCMARYIMLRVTEGHNVICSISPKPMDGDWNGAGCHTNFSTEGMRQQGGYKDIITVCDAFRPVAAEHIAQYGAGNDKRLTGKHETCSINDFKYGVADRGASIRIPRDAEKDGRGYMEDRRPGANCDPYAVTGIMMKTAGAALPPAPSAEPFVQKPGKDAGGMGLALMDSFEGCVLAEYVWVDAHQVPRSKTMTMTCLPTSIEGLRVWNYDGSSTEQADGHNSEVMLYPRAIFKDPFRGAPHILVMCDVWNAWDGQPTIGNTRANCAAIMSKYAAHDPWFGIEQEYTLMRPGKVGEIPTMPFGFNEDGSEPGPQGPYYCSAGTGAAIGRIVADDHYKKCMAAGVKIAGVNAEVMPGQWEYQVGPCRGVEMGDHLAMARYIMLRVTESHNVMCSISPKPKDGDWNGAGCHTNFSIESMRNPGGYEVIIKVCDAFRPVAADHIAQYGADNDKRLTGKHETCSINDFKYGVADRGASIRIPRDAEKNGCGYMEDRRPGANCDPYAVTAIMMKTAGECLA